MTLTIESDAFAHDAVIPTKYTCEGDDRSPPLRWSGAPEGTRSFVLRVLDPDAPGGTFTHWLLYDVPASAEGLGEGESGRGVPGRNDFERIGWGGPCPPPKHGDHRYHFTLSALDRDGLGLAEGASRDEVEKAMEGHVLAEARWTGRYARD